MFCSFSFFPFLEASAFDEMGALDTSSSSSCFAFAFALAIPREVFGFLTLDSYEEVDDSPMLSLLSVEGRESR